MIPSKKLEIIQKRVRNNCEGCMGSGCNKCRAKLSRFKSYASSGIPMNYWDLSLKDFQGDKNFKKFLINKVSDIQKMYEDGCSLAFIGNLGTGKTYAASCILKMAIVNGFSASYINMSDIVTEIVSGNVNNAKFLNDLVSVDFLVIDEFDKRYIFPSEKAERLFGQNLEYVLRNRFQNYMPTILCSNTQNIDDVLSEDFSRAFSSLRSKYMKVIYVAGKDFRKLNSGE